MSNQILQAGEYYHIYNRGNNGEILFKNPENYSYFLSLYAKYMSPVVDTLAYCLMSNHFHLLIRTREQSQIKSFSELSMFENSIGGKSSSKKPTVSNQFAHLFSTYTKAINKRYNRTGSLFEHPFERRMIENDDYLLNCIAYIHFNPVKAGFVDAVNEYKWSSFNAIVSTSPTSIEREFVLNLFGDVEGFKLYHAVSKLQNIVDF